MEIAEENRPCSKSRRAVPPGRWHLHTRDDDLDLGRAPVDEEFDAVDET